MICVSRINLGALVGVALTLSAGAACAADWPDINFLRPGITPSRWGGYYAGGHYGHTSSSVDFGNSLQSIVGAHLRNTALEAQFSPSTWTTLPKKSTSSQTFGGMFGYNVDWGDLVIGVEGAYTYLNQNASGADTIARSVTLNDGTRDDVTITGSSSLRLQDNISLKTRFGYAFGQFLPYVGVGVAIGRFNYSSTATTTTVQTPSGGGPTTFVDGPTTEARNNAFQAGFAGSVGLDVLITPNLFLRGEWEYVGYGKVHGMKSDTQTGRVALGVRF